jgi:predicted DNA-binding protein
LYAQTLEVKMLTVRLPDELEIGLNNLAQALSTQKSKIVIAALQQYIEDKQDYILASNVYAANNSSYTHEEVLRELGL